MLFVADKRTYFVVAIRNESTVYQVASIKFVVLLPNILQPISCTQLTQEQHVDRS